MIKPEISISIVDKDSFDLEKIYKLRFIHYKIKNKESLFPNKLIYDEYDNNSHHLILSIDNNIAGFLRISINTKMNLEIEKYIDISDLESFFLCAETSKFFVLPKYRGPYIKIINEHLIRFLQNSGIQLEFIYFKAGLKPGLLEKFYKKFGYVFSHNLFLYKSNSSIANNEQHKIGIRLINHKTSI